MVRRSVEREPDISDKDYEKNDPELLENALKGKLGKDVEGEFLKPEEEDDDEGLSSDYEQLQKAKVDLEKAEEDLERTKDPELQKQLKKSIKGLKGKIFKIRRQAYGSEEAA